MNELYDLNGVIYMIENTVNGMKYIGQTTHTFAKRYRRCKWWGSASNNPYLKSATAKYGISAFKVTILEHSKDVQELNRLEAEYAEKFNTYAPNGYNLVQCGNNKTQHPDSIAKRSRTVILNDPNGKDVVVTNIRKFCRDHNLSNRSCCRMLKGEFASCGGWSLQGVTDKHHRNNRRYTFYDQSGQKYDIVGLTAFCKERNLTYHGMRNMVQGKLFESQGYALCMENFTKQRRKHIVTLTNGDQDIELNNIKRECREHGLHAKHIYELIHRKREFYKGWRVKSLSSEVI